MTHIRFSLHSEIDFHLFLSKKKKFHFTYPDEGSNRYIYIPHCTVTALNDIFALRGWKTEEINGIEFELNSILVDKWNGKAYRLVIPRQKRLDGVLDLWEGEYTYRCILTNDYESSAREIVEFYNLRGGKERFH